MKKRMLFYLLLIIFLATFVDANQKVSNYLTITDYDIYNRCQDSVTGKEVECRLLNIKTEQKDALKLEVDELDFQNFVFSRNYNGGIYGIEFTSSGKKYIGDSDLYLTSLIDNLSTSSASTSHVTLIAPDNATFNGILSFNFNKGGLTFVDIHGVIIENNEQKISLLETT